MKQQPGRGGHSLDRRQNHPFTDGNVTFLHTSVITVLNKYKPGVIYSSTMVLSPVCRGGVGRRGGCHRYTRHWWESNPFSPKKMDTTQIAKADKCRRVTQERYMYDIIPPKTQSHRVHSRHDVTTTYRKTGRRGRTAKYTGTDWASKIIQARCFISRTSTVVHERRALSQLGFWQQLQVP